jgi:ferredoxin
MAKLRIKNSEIVLDIQDNEQDILSVLKEAEVYVKSSCGGHASCGDCIIKVVSGEDHLTPPPFDEIKLLGNVFHITKERLACQTKLTGDVTIDISQHDEGKDQQKLKNKKHKSQPRVRKQAQVQEILDERKASSAEKTKARDDKDNSYFEHWKKEKDPDAPPKKLDGGNRPRPFVTPEPEPEPEQVVESESVNEADSDDIDSENKH